MPIKALRSCRRFLKNAAVTLHRNNNNSEEMYLFWRNNCLLVRHHGGNLLQHVSVHEQERLPVLHEALLVGVVDSHQAVDSIVAAILQQIQVIPVHTRNA